MGHTVRKLANPEEFVTWQQAITQMLLVNINKQQCNVRRSTLSESVDRPLATKYKRTATAANLTTGRENLFKIRLISRQAKLNHCLVFACYSLVSCKGLKLLALKSPSEDQ